jgi:hypothetical protein
MRKSFFYYPEKQTGKQSVKQNEKSDGKDFEMLLLFC